MFKFLCIVFIVLLWRLTISAKSIKDDKFFIVGGYRPSQPSILERYMVSIRRHENFFGAGHICGGTILTKTAVLTAAHCLYDSRRGRPVSRRSLFVVIGSRNRLIRDSNSKKYDIALVVVHEGYNGRINLYNDIGILRTRKTIDLKSGVAELVQLPIQLPPNYSKTTAVGWGRMWTNGPMPNELLFTDMFLWGKLECMMVHYMFHPGMMICAGSSRGSNEDSCQGDSGGPLFSKGEQIGIVSFGIDCGRGLPGVYTDVTAYSDWIDYNYSNILSPNIMLSLIAPLLCNQF